MVDFQLPDIIRSAQTSINEIQSRIFTTNPRARSRLGDITAETQTLNELIQFRDNQIEATGISSQDIEQRIQSLTSQLRIVPEEQRQTVPVQTRTRGVINQEQCINCSEVGQATAFNTSVTQEIDLLKSLRGVFPNQQQNTVSTSSSSISPSTIPIAIGALALAVILSR